MFDAGPRYLVEDFQQAAGVLASLEGSPPQGGDAGGGVGSVDDLKQASGDTEADALGLGDGGEVVVELRGEDDGVLESVVEGLNLGVLAVELFLEPLAASQGGLGIEGQDDVVSLAVEGLSRLLAALGHGGDVTVSSAQDGKGRGDALGDRGHGESIRRGQGRGSSDPDDCTCPDGNCPGKPHGKGRF